MKNKKVIGLVEKYCKECNKLIFPTPNWAYKIGYNYYCSYKCYRKAGGDNGEYKTRGPNRYL